MIRSFVPSASTVAAAVCAGLVAAPLAGAPAPAAGATKLTLSVTADAGWARAVVLRCHPARGPHPTPGEACAALQAAGGDPARLRPARTMCTMQFAPVTAEARGVWRGARVRWTRVFGNACELSRATGVVFRF
jgi:hypothetical protein